MKFLDILKNIFTSDSEYQYFAYEEAQNIMYSFDPLIIERAPLTEEDFFLGKHREYYRDVEDKFFAFLDVELEKINVFYKEKAANADRKLSHLVEELKIFYDESGVRYGLLRSRHINRPHTQNEISSGSFSNSRNGSECDDLQAIWQQTAHLYQKWKLSSRYRELKECFMEFYWYLIKLRDYQKLNYLGFTKILGEYNWVIGSFTKTEFFFDTIKNADFHNDDMIRKRIRRTERIYIEEFGYSDYWEGLQELGSLPLTPRKMLDFPSFSFGGAVHTTIILIVLLIYRLSNNLPEKFLDIAPFFAVQLLLSAYFILFALNMYGWERSGVNRVLIFEINPWEHMTCIQMFTVGFIGFFSTSMLRHVSSLFLHDMRCEFLCYSSKP